MVALSLVVNSYTAGALAISLAPWLSAWRLGYQPIRLDGRDYLAFNFRQHKAKWAQSYGIIGLWI